MTDRVWILGAPDPEMEAIETLLRECGERVEYAIDDRGQRVSPATAYRCPPLKVPAGSTVYAVECFDVLPEGWVRIDHHRPGDPGYGRQPHEFLPASSIGQVVVVLARLGVLPESWERFGGQAAGLAACSLGTIGRFQLRHYGAPYELGVTSVSGPLRSLHVYVIPEAIIFAAAADHCLGAAYRGECPGVDPDALMRWRVEQRATFQGRNAGQILDDIERARDLLSDPDTVELAPGIRVADVRGYCVVTHDCGHKELQHEDYTTHLSHKHGCPGSPYTPRQWCNGWIVEPGIPELPDAAAREGVAYIATVTVDGSGRECRPKVVLGGCTTPEMVRAFLVHWAPQQGLVDCYGDPERGFAGGYYLEEK